MKKPTVVLLYTFPNKAKMLHVLVVYYCVGDILLIFTTIYKGSALLMLE